EPAVRQSRRPGLLGGRARALADGEPRDVLAARILRNRPPDARRHVVDRRQPRERRGACVPGRHAALRRRARARPPGARLGRPRGAAAARGSGDMKRLRIGFLVASRFAQSTGHVPALMRALSDAGVVVDVIHPTQGALDLSDVRVEHDLYFLKKVSRLSLSIAGALHAQGATIVNPYPVSVVLRDKIVTTRILQLAGVPTP